VFLAMMSGFPDFAYIAASLPEFGEPGKPSEPPIWSTPGSILGENRRTPGKCADAGAAQIRGFRTAAFRVIARVELAFPSGGPAVYPHDDATSTSFVAGKLSEFLQEADHVVSKLDLRVRAGRHPDGGGGRRAGGR
jgi:hypothetical protein